MFRLITYCLRDLRRIIKVQLKDHFIRCEIRDLPCEVDIPSDTTSLHRQYQYRSIESLILFWHDNLPVKFNLDYSLSANRLDSRIQILRCSVFIIHCIIFIRIIGIRCGCDIRLHYDEEGVGFSSLARVVVIN
jgi:hypothetical protein